MGYTDELTAKSRNTLYENPGLMRLLDLETVRADIREARAQGANCVIVCVSWGRADATGVTSAQRTMAQALAQAGADMIVGTRPSRVLPMELITCRGEEGRMRQTLAMYSLGTLVTESRDGYDISGILLHLDITVDPQGTLHFDTIDYTPTYIWRQTVEGRTQFRVVCSASEAPEGMNADQQRYMQNALNRIQKTLNESPARQRK